MTDAFSRRCNSPHSFSESDADVPCPNRKYDGDRVSRHPQCEALEFVLDGFALDRCGHERSQERLSQAQSLQATSCLAGRACRSLRKGDQQSRSCPNCEGRLTSFTATTASQSSTEHGAIPEVEP